MSCLLVKVILDCVSEYSVQILWGFIVVEDHLDQGVVAFRLSDQLLEHILSHITESDEQILN